MKNLLIHLFFTLYVIHFTSNLFSQETKKSEEFYFKVIKESKKISVNNLTTFDLKKGNCGRFDGKTKTLVSEKPCRQIEYLKPLDRSLPLEFEMEFTPTITHENLDSSWLFSLNLLDDFYGQIWIGFDKEGTLIISQGAKEYKPRAKKKWYDRLRVSKKDKVHFDKKNYLRFLHFPDGTFYVELNSYKRWSFDLDLSLTGYGSNTQLNFSTTIKMYKFGLNQFKNQVYQSFFENDARKKQIKHLKSLKTDNDRLKFGDYRRVAFDERCSGDCENGYGVKIYYGGYQHVGNWKNGKEHGEGTHYYKRKIMYKGSFKEGKFHGSGTRYNTRTGEIMKKGIWVNGKLDKSAGPYIDNE